jgi:hypothetical protein
MKFIFCVMEEKETQPLQKTEIKFRVRAHVRIGLSPETQPNSDLQRSALSRRPMHSDGVAVAWVLFSFVVMLPTPAARRVFMSLHVLTF